MLTVCFLHPSVGVSVPSPSEITSKPLKSPLCCILKSLADWRVSYLHPKKLLHLSQTETGSERSIPKTDESVAP